MNNFEKMKQAILSLLSGIKKEELCILIGELNEHDVKLPKVLFTCNWCEATFECSGSGPDECTQKFSDYCSVVEQDDNAYNGICIYVPEQRHLISIYEGLGGNLLREDIQEGYVDYINYDVFCVENGEIEEYDGGMVLLKQLFREQYSSTVDAIPAVLDMAYGNEGLGYIVL